MKTLQLFLILFVTIGFMSCKDSSKKKDTNSTNTTNQEEEKPEVGNWEILFDGQNFDKWRGYGQEEMFPEWSIEPDGSMKFTPGAKGGKNIITKDQFTNFVLSLEWKISEGGNSGIFWAVQDIPEYKEAYETGPEIQVLDNERHPDANVGGKTHQAGALYDMMEPMQDVANPAGEWNTVELRIDYDNNIGTETMNGVEILTFPVTGQEWKDMVAKSKFADWPGFASSETGHIGLQDHGDEVWYRNIKIRQIGLGEE